MLDTLSQITITLFGGTALWLMNCRNERRRRWGVICGLCSQPAWYVQMVLHAQWLMLPVYLCYTGAWLFGLWNHWLRRRLRPNGPLAAQGDQHLIWDDARRAYRWTHRGQTWWFQCRPAPDGGLSLSSKEITPILSLILSGKMAVDP